MKKEGKVYEIIDSLFQQILAALKNTKPDERNELARRHAVAITGLEKIYAYFRFYIMDKE